LFSRFLLLQRIKSIEKKKGRETKGKKKKGGRKHLPSSFHPSGEEGGKRGRGERRGGKRGRGRRKGKRAVLLPWISSESPYYEIARGERRKKGKSYGKGGGTLKREREEEGKAGGGGHPSA